MWRAIKQFTARISATVESAAQSIENHEALVDSAIRSLRRGVARARVQVERVHQDGERIAARVEQLEEDAKRWRERAVQTAEVDEAKALACMKRLRRVEAERETLVARRAEHVKVEERIRRDIERMGEKLEGLISQRNLLRTRATRADALAIAASAPTSVLQELDGVPWLQ